MYTSVDSGESDDTKANEAEKPDGATCSRGRKVEVEKATQTYNGAAGSNKQSAARLAPTHGQQPSTPAL